jgi:hypothetical protein
MSHDLERCPIQDFIPRFFTVLTGSGKSMAIMATKRGTESLGGLLSSDRFILQVCAAKKKSASAAVIMYEKTDLLKNMRGEKINP